MTPETLLEKGIVSRLSDGVKILGDGDLSGSLTIRAHAFSKGAREKITAAGGTVELIEA